MILISILFICLVFYGIKVAPKNVFYDNEPSLQTSLSLKGICCIMIMMYHMNQLIGVQNGIMIFANIGTIATGTFFFLSGYGLMFSFSKKENYLKHFFKRTFSKIIFPYLLAIFLYFIVHIIFDDYVSIVGIIYSYLKGIPFVNYTWYIVAIVFFYIAFYFAFAFFKDSNKRFLKPNIVFLILNVLYIFICVKLGYLRCWYNTAFCFGLGILYCQNIEYVQNFIRKKYLFKLITIFVISCLFFILSMKYAKSYETLHICYANLSSLTFVIFVISLLNKVKFSNKVSAFLGKISFEIYIYHGLVYITLAYYIKMQNKNLLMLTALSVTLILAYTINIIWNKSQKIVNKYMQQSKTRIKKG